MSGYDIVRAYLGKSESDVGIVAPVEGFSPQIGILFR